MTSVLIETIKNNANSMPLPISSILKRTNHFAILIASNSAASGSNNI